jgi:hypothetical protein
MLESMHAAGTLPITRAVVDPAYVVDQSDLLDALRSAARPLTSARKK